MLRRQIEDSCDVIHDSLDGVDIAFGQPDPKKVIESGRLRWIHVNTAGYTKYDRDDVRAALRARGAILTNSSSVYCEPCAQHVLALILSGTRRLVQSHDNQRGPRGWPMDELRARTALLRGQNILLVGFGAIGRRLAELLVPFQVNIVAVRRTPAADERVKVVGPDQLDGLLGWADHVVDLLPASDSTQYLFEADRFAQMKRTAIFYNIGRGDTVDQIALRTALETESIAGAFLDVVTPEPLPIDDPLWTTPNCWITPHAAGGHANEVDRVVKHFLENLKRFTRGEALWDRVI
jgi:phosphoglycerate dehydrogenase-like enzyme